MCGLIARLNDLIERWRDEACQRSNDQYYRIHADELEEVMKRDLALKQMDIYNGKYCLKCKSLCGMYDQGLSCDCEDGRKWLTERVHEEDYPDYWIDVSVEIKARDYKIRKNKSAERSLNYE